ncbi:MAG: hypothetical protein BJ554DRAFT_4003, partial [Olpidium bornovanus]
PPSFGPRALLLSLPCRPLRNKPVLGRGTPLPLYLPPPPPRPLTSNTPLPSSTSRPPVVTDPCSPKHAAGGPHQELRRRVVAPLPAWHCLYSSRRGSMGRRRVPHRSRVRSLLAEALLRHVLQHRRVLAKLLGARHKGSLGAGAHPAQADEYRVCASRRSVSVCVCVCGRARPWVPRAGVYVLPGPQT